jgi:hypothetical protein
MPRSAPQSLAARALDVVLGVGVAVFLVACGVGVAVAVWREPSFSPWVRAVMYACVALLVGALAIGCLAGAFRALRGEPAILRAARGRCPACGEPARGPAADGRDHCPEARESGGEWYEIPRFRPGEGLFRAALGAGIACGGLGLVGVGGRSPAAILFCLAVGALVMLLGGQFLVTGARDARDAWKAPSVPEAAFDSVPWSRTGVHARAHLSRGHLFMQGRTERTSPHAGVPVDAHSPPPGDAAERALVHVLAVLHARKKVELGRVETGEWTLDGVLTRRRHADVTVRRTQALDADPAEPSSPAFDARERALAALDRVRVTDIALAMLDAPEVANAFETYAASLPASEADERVAAILASVLSTGPAPPPYRGAF